MDVKVDSVGRILIPKAMREQAGISPGSTVDVSFYGAGITVLAGGRSRSPLVEEDGRLVIGGDVPFTDDEMYRLVDEGRR